MGGDIIYLFFSGEEFWRAIANTVQEGTPEVLHGSNSRPELLAKIPDHSLFIWTFKVLPFFFFFFCLLLLQLTLQQTSLSTGHLQCNVIDSRQQKVNILMKVDALCQNDLKIIMLIYNI